MNSEPALFSCALIGWTLFICACVLWRRTWQNARKATKLAKEKAACCDKLQESVDHWWKRALQAEANLRGLETRLGDLTRRLSDLLALAAPAARAKAGQLSPSTTEKPKDASRNGVSAR